MKIIKAVLPHAVIILAGIFMVFMVLDQYNPTMDFVNNDTSIALLWAFCVLSIISSIITSAKNRREKRGNAKQ